MTQSVPQIGDYIYLSEVGGSAARPCIARVHKVVVVANGLAPVVNGLFSFCGNDRVLTDLETVEFLLAGELYVQTNKKKNRWRKIRGFDSTRY